MKLFLKYIKTKAKTFSALLVFAVIFYFSFVLYKLPLKAIAYPLFLSAFIGLIFLLYDFFKVKKKHNDLIKMQELYKDDLIGPIKSNTIPEEDYSKLASLLKQEITNIKADDFKKYCDMVEYYTVWAHQIKTPIASMKLTLQNEDSELSRKLNSDLFRTQRYVDMVLAFLRLNSPSTDYLFREYSLDDIIRPSIKKFASEFITRRLTLNYENIPNKVITDEKWLSFVIEQLLSNSLKYTREGSISVFLKDGNKICIEDTGIGIAPDDLPRIFEKGYTGYNGRLDKTASGLGLYLCKMVCDNLGLKIFANSEIGKGTTVTIEFSNNKTKYQ